MAVNFSPLLLAVVLMIKGGTALFIDFTINTTTLYHQELTCSAHCNGTNSSNVNAISSIDIIEVHGTTEKRIATLNSILRKPISLGKGVVTRIDGSLSEKEGHLSIGVRADTSVLKYACKAAFYDNKYDVVTIEKVHDNKANVLFSMLNQRFAGIASGIDFDTTLQDIEKKFVETSGSVSKISEAVTKVQDQLDLRSNEVIAVFKKLGDISQTLSQMTQKLDAMVNETRQKTKEEPPTLVSSCNVFRNGAVPASSPLMPITLPDTSPVLCDTVTDGGGWTIFQRRINGDVDFYRNWTSYEKGFGKMSTNFWLGLETLRSLMNEGPQELRVDIEHKGKRYFAKYSQFSVGAASSYYKLHVSGYSGDAGDSLEYHSGMAFSTFDRDNDNRSSGNCAKIYSGAWWYNDCHNTNLNGKWGQGSKRGPRWRLTTGVGPASFTEMKTRLVL